MRKSVAAVCLALSFFIASAHAQSCGPLPYTITNGTVADATQVMANYTALLNCVNSNTQNLSSQLDSNFGSTQGTVLYRGASGWTVLAPGASGQVLASGGAGANPYWTNGGGGPSFFLNPSAGGPYVESAAAIGNVATPNLNLTVVALGAVLTTVTSGVYDLCIAPYNSITNQMTASATCTPSFTETSGTANKNIYETFASPFAMSAGTTYIAFFVRTDSTATVSQSINYSGTAVGGPGITFLATGTARMLGSTNPTTSQAWASAGGGVWTIQLAYHL